MAVNLHLTDWHEAAADDAWGRSWVGWRADFTDAELWELNRGTWAISDAADRERYATMSHKGIVRVVAELTGPREAVVEGGRVLHALAGIVLAPGHPAYEALIGRQVNGRNVSYLAAPELESRAPWHAREGFLLTHNPEKWDWDEQEFLTAVEVTRSGSLYRSSWSMGSRTRDVELGDRAFLVRLGNMGRGIVASGTIAGPVYFDEHFDGSGRPGTFVLVDWDTILEPDDRLELADLDAALPDQHWHPQGSGTQIRPGVLPQLEALWAKHLSALGRPSPKLPGSSKPESGSTSGRRGRQGWQDDPAVRKAVEDAAQTRLEEHFRSDGWTVTDVRHSKLGYDALAVKGSVERYLEAKGTVTDGASVIVTPAEVEWARGHPGSCVMGILSCVTVSDDGTVDASSGVFEVIRWDPDAGTLRPRGYDWVPAFSSRSEREAK